MGAMAKRTPNPLGPASGTDPLGAVPRYRDPTPAPAPVPRRSRSRAGRAPGRRARPLRHPCTVVLVEELRQALRSKGISLAQAQRLVGVYSQASSRIFTGRRSPQLDTLAALAECVGLELRWGKRRAPKAAPE